MTQWALENSVSAARCLRDTDVVFTYFAEVCMETEVRMLCGPRRCRTSEYQRWGTNPGSIPDGNERVPVRVPRVRHTKTNTERPLKTYKVLHEKRPEDAKALFNQLLLGLSQRDYPAAVQAHCDSMGLSRSTVGRMFIEQSIAVLEEFESRRLDQEKFCALLIDGKCFQKRQMIVAIGLTETGKKVMLGVVESTTETAAAVETLLEDIIERGFAFDTQLLVILDGAKGLRKAVQQTFGDQAIIQRCQIHKRRNVTRRITNKAAAEQVKKQLQQAWEKDTYTEARGAQHTLLEELKARYPRAAASLEEGLEDTLALHKLGIRKALRDHLKTTNIIENLNSVLAHRSRNVKRWRSSYQRHRWCASIFVCYESKLNRIDPLLMQELVIALKKRETKPLKYPSTIIHHPLLTN